MSKSPRIKILVAHHKPGYIFENDIFLPIQVGKAVSNVDLGIQGDDTEDNISHLNPYYCELTAIYWAWKNLDADYYGLNHYRRYFTDSKPSIFDNKFIYNKLLSSVLKKRKIICRVEEVGMNVKILNEKLNYVSERINSLIQNGIIIISPTRTYLGNMTVESYFSDILGERHIKPLIEIIRLEFPYLMETLSQTLSSNFIYATNIFVMKKALFFEYSNILFKVLDLHIKSENKSFGNLESYDRISGYMGELITNLFIQYCSSKGILHKEEYLMFIK